MDGSDRYNVVSTGLTRPHALTVFGQTLYWADGTQQAIMSCDKRNGLSAARIEHKVIANPTALHVYHESRQPRGE